jgi:glycosyltransferase involved in cell wall biosynthesis
MNEARILLLPWDEPQNASARCRIFDLAAWLRDHGWNVRVGAPVGGAIGRALAAPGPGRRIRRLFYRALQIPIRLRQLAGVASYDVVVIQRELYPYGPPWMERRLFRSARAVVFDLDDALHLPPSHFRNRAHGLHDFGKAAEIARRARAVVVSSAALEKWAREMADHVVLIPTAVDTERFRPIAFDEPAPGDGPDRVSLVIGWTGTAGNLGHLESIRPALAAAAREVPFVLRIVGESPPSAEWNEPRTEFVRWSLEREAAEVAQFDVGLMPLIDSEYARAKAGYKALVYMACGVPALVSPVGTNLEIMNDGVEGFFASTEEEWRARLVQLLRDRALRRGMGRAARARVIAERSIESVFPRWEPLLRSLLSSEAP